MISSRLNNQSRNCFHGIQLEAVLDDVGYVISTLAVYIYLLCSSQPSGRHKTLAWPERRPLKPRFTLAAKSIYNRRPHMWPVVVPQSENTLPPARKCSCTATSRGSTSMPEGWLLGDEGGITGSWDSCSRVSNMERPTWRHCLCSLLYRSRFFSVI